ncbi:MAG TPA: hypothetical protein VGN20_03525 [Mucilaginibacter sp.]|jgi:hypothetical protein
MKIFKLFIASIIFAIIAFSSVKTHQQNKTVDNLYMSGFENNIFKSNHEASNTPINKSVLFLILTGGAVICKIVYDKRQANISL